MKNVARMALAVGAVALVAGCGAIQPPVGPPAAIPQSRTIAKHDDRLLYISDEGTNDVYVYSLSKGTIVETLTGFSEPRGVCLDNAGDIWITEAGNSKLIEYAPGGTKPIASVNDPGEFPVDCSINGTTGNLGAANIISAKYGPGSLSVYSGTVGAPAIVRAFAHTYDAAYDLAGNLFVDGADDHGWSQFGELARGAKTVVPLTLKGGTISNPINLQYADGHLAIGDDRGYSEDSVIYQVAVKGSAAKVIGRTRLHDANVIAFFIVGSQVFCLNSTKLGVRVDVYNYPAGGRATTVIKVSGLSMPVGLAVTTAK